MRSTRARRRRRVYGFTAAMAAAAGLVANAPSAVVVNGFSVSSSSFHRMMPIKASYNTNIGTTRRSQKMQQRQRRRTLTTAANDDDMAENNSSESSSDESDDDKSPLENDPPKRKGPLQRAVAKFRARPTTYLIIPCIAALVGWLTNWLAVQMIFYPIQFRGIRIWQPTEVPLGLIGWQGIVPCKTRPMGEAMVEMVSTQLLTVKEVFGRLDPKQVAKLLGPRVPMLGQEILQDFTTTTATSPTVGRLGWLIQSLPNAVYAGLTSASQRVLQLWNVQFLQNLTRDMQANIDSLFSLRNCVLNQMLADRTILGNLFRKCGQAELDFLTNSGLWFGFLLGLIQMVVALFWDNPWTLSIGGGIVGLATNWLALKWIFEPVDPMRIWGTNIVLQGQFLRRQKEVAKEFSAFFARNILTSQQLWTSVLTDPTTYPNFCVLFAKHFQGFVRRISRGLGLAHFLEPETLQTVTHKALEKLPNHVPVLYEYMDDAMQLESTLRVRMEGMTSRQFERVLHPIFEEDELTLILAGAALGFGAGLIQQGLETGKLKFPSWQELRENLSWRNVSQIPKRQVQRLSNLTWKSVYQIPKRQTHRVVRRVNKTKEALLEWLSKKRGKAQEKEEEDP